MEPMRSLYLSKANKRRKIFDSDSDQIVRLFGFVCHYLLYVLRHSSLQYINVRQQSVAQCTMHTRQINLILILLFVVVIFAVNASVQCNMKIIFICSFMLCWRIFVCSSYTYHMSNCGQLNCTSYEATIDDRQVRN